MVAETLVDASGYYEFPNGVLTAEPEVQTANFVQLPDQLTRGASVLMASVGSDRLAGWADSFFDEFN